MAGAHHPIATLKEERKHGAMFATGTTLAHHNTASKCTLQEGCGGVVHRPGLGGDVALMSHTIHT